MKDAKEKEIQIIETLTRFEQTGIALSLDAVSKVSRVEYTETIAIVQRLIGKQCITVIRGEHIVTTKGHQYCRDQRTKQGNSDSRAFKEEALTGLSQEKSDVSGFMVSVQSEIDRAVLSTAKGEISRGKDPEELTALMQDRKKQVRFIQESLGVSPKVYCQLMQEGRIRVCNGWDGEKHIGIFHKKRDRFQHLCQECFKKYKKGKDSVRSD